MKLKEKYKYKKTITSRELGRLLKVNGFVLIRTTGDHRVYQKGNDSVVVNMRNLNRMVAQRLIKENHLLGPDDQS